jgi:hypothetical protein
MRGFYSGSRCTIVGYLTGGVDLLKGEFCAREPDRKRWQTNVSRTVLPL